MRFVTSICHCAQALRNHTTHTKPIGPGRCKSAMITIWPQGAREQAAWIDLRRRGLDIQSIYN